jgi:hypothetical protein
MVEPDEESVGRFIVWHYRVDPAQRGGTSRLRYDDRTVAVDLVPDRSEGD